jgi:type IV secretion system protein VirB6
MDLFQNIFKLLDLALATYITDTVANLVAYLSPIFTSALIIYIAMWGYMMLFGRVQEFLTDSFFRMLRITCIVTFGLTVGTYHSVVVNFLQGFPEKISNVVSGAAGAGAGATLDALFEKVYIVASTAWEQGGVMNGNFGLYILAGIILGVGCVFCVYVAFLMLLGKIVVTMLLAIGPLFITCLLFTTTQRYFEAWISALMNYSFVLILSVALGSMVLSFATSYINAMAPDESALENMANLFDVGALCIIFGLSWLVIQQVPTMAASLGGGFSLAVNGAISSAVSKTRPTNIRRELYKTKRDLQYVGQAVSGPTGVAMKAAQKVFKRNSVSQR